jgi:hypothetical protein
MYSTCFHCHGPLGKNELIEHFPVGRRLAFDPAKGRLWVVCAKCRRWNLTPLEERWEAIEECERLYRGTRLRASTDNVGLARLADGMEVVRIGKPETPEIAAWRYAHDFRRRWRRRGAPLTILGVGSSRGAIAAAMLGGVVTIAALAIVGSAAAILKWRHARPRVALPDGRVTRLSEAEAGEICLRPVDGGWGIYGPVVSRDGMTSGPAAERIMRSVMTARNYRGAESTDVDDAIAMLNDAGSADRLLRAIARATQDRNISTLPSQVSLALEMGLHEDLERRSLDGELAELELEWKVADEIAQIADDMFLPAGVTDALRKSTEVGTSAR